MPSLNSAQSLTAVIPSVPTSMSVQATQEARIWLNSPMCTIGKSTNYHIEAKYAAHIKLLK